MVKELLLLYKEEIYQIYYWQKLDNLIGSFYLSLTIDFDNFCKKIFSSSYFKRQILFLILNKFTSRRGRVRRRDARSIRIGSSSKFGKRIQYL